MESQHSIIPDRKRVKTIPINSSQHDIELGSNKFMINTKQPIAIQQVSKELDINGNSLRRSQRLQEFQRSQKSEINDELFQKSQDMNLSQNINFSSSKIFDFEPWKSSLDVRRGNAKALNLNLKNSQGGISLISNENVPMHPSQFLKSNLDPSKSEVRYDPSIPTQKQFSQIVNKFSQNPFQNNVMINAHDLQKFNISIGSKNEKSESEPEVDFNFNNTPALFQNDL